MRHLTSVLRHLPRTFETLGFRPQGNGFVRKGLRAHIDQSWCTFRCSGRSPQPDAEPQGGPGLWKPVSDLTSSHARYEFHLPLGVLGATLVGPLDEQVALVRPVIEWVETTSVGSVPSWWRPPPRSSLDDWVPEDRYTARADPFVRQGALTANDQQFSIEIPLVSARPLTLSPARRSWMQMLTRNAQRKYRMVRVTWSHPSTAAPAVCAGTDLTGVPEPILPDLLRLAVDATRDVAARLLTPVNLLCDSDLPCATWEVAATDLFPQRASCKT